MAFTNRVTSFERAYKEYNEKGQSWIEEMEDDGQLQMVKSVVHTNSDPINCEQVEQILGEYGLSFLRIYRDDVFQLAMISGKVRKPNNQRLEFIGDGLLYAATGCWLYRNLPFADEGKMSDGKANLVQNKTLARIAEWVGLVPFVRPRISASTIDSIREKQLSCAFEAFLAALYLHSNQIPMSAGTENEYAYVGMGFHHVCIFIDKIYNRHFDKQQIMSIQENHKRILQETLQSIYRVKPIYKVIEMVGLEYVVGVYLVFSKTEQVVDTNMAIDAKYFASAAILEEEVNINNRMFVIFLGKASNMNKQKAEQAAAGIALDEARHLLSTSEKGYK